VNDDELKRAYEGWLAKRATAGRSGCPDGEALLALAERRGVEEQRLATLDHALACADCRRDLELLRSVVEAGTREGVVSRALPWWQTRPLRAAAAIVLLGLTGTAVFFMSRQDRTVMRGEIGAAVGIAPQGEVPLEEVRRLVWHATPNATRYDVELLTDQGQSMFVTTTRDTSVLVPWGSVQPGRAYLWTLRAQRPDGNQAEAVPLRFRIMP